MKHARKVVIHYMRDVSPAEHFSVELRNPSKRKIDEVISAIYTQGEDFEVYKVEEFSAE